MRRLLPKAALAAGLLLSLATAYAQTSTSAVRGTVRDQSGAVVPRASITITNTGTNIAHRTAANEVGIYVIPGVRPGPYRIVVEAPGMQKFEGTLTLQVQQDAVVNPVLSVGQVTAEVVVQDVTPTVVEDRPTLGHVLERARIEQLPLNGRSFSSLMITVPGMEGWRAFGLRDGSHEFVLDGSPIAQRMTMMTAIINRPPGLDTIQEFKVETNNSSAKYTRPVTAVATTKSGTNQFHGAGFYTHRSNFVLGPFIGKARSRTDTWQRAPKMYRHEWGSSAGGPVHLPKLYHGKDRTFWFFAYEGTRSNSPSTTGYTVPTEAMRNGDFRGLVDSQGRLSRIYDPWTTNATTWVRQPFAYGGQANVIDPKLLNPLAKYLYGITPLPTLPDQNPLLDNNWWGPVDSIRKNWTITTRLDHRFGDNDTFYGRYTQGQYYSWWSLDGAGSPGPPVKDGVSNNEVGTAPNKVLAVSHVHTFSPTLFNELLFSTTREVWRTATGGMQKYADQLGLPNPFNASGWPQLSGSGLSRLGWYTQNAMGTNFTYYILDDNVTKVHGKHEFQFGVHMRYDQLYTLPDQQQGQGGHQWSSLGTTLYDPSSSRTNPQGTPFTGHNQANLFLGVMTYSANMTRGYFYTIGKEHALYFQDNYKATQRLTLNLGVRWEYWPAFWEKNNLMTGFDPQQRAIVLGAPLEKLYALGATVPSVVNRYAGWGAKYITADQAGLPDRLMHSNGRNFGPRLGFAYRVGDGGKAFVIRGGYRTSYYPVPVRYWTATMRSNAPLTAWFYNNPNSSSMSPDGIGNYLMRSVPDILAGVNSRDAVRTDNPTSLSRGSAGSNYFDPHQPDGKVHDWNITFEKEVMKDTVARVAYIGNHGVNMEQVEPFNDSVPEYIWYMTTGKPLPTGEFSGVARRPYDQQVYGSLRRWTKTGWSNYNGVQMELERRYSKGIAFQVFYVIGNAFAAGGQSWSGSSLLTTPEQFLPGAVPTDFDKRNRFLNYQRDTSIPKHRIRWNWIADLPFGRGKPIAGNAGGLLNRFIGGWQLAGTGYLRSNFQSLPTGTYPNGNAIEYYGYKYPIQDCTGGTCYPGYLWNNAGYIPANRINSYDPVTGRPNGIMGVPADYKSVSQPIWPWPANPQSSDPMYPYYGSNTVWVPLSNGVLQRTTYNENLHPWRQQYYPSVRQWGLDASLFKTIPVTERVNLRFNLDYFNVLNHPNNPTGVSGMGILSTRSSGSGARELQLTLRLTW